MARIEGVLRSRRCPPEKRLGVIEDTVFKLREADIVTIDKGEGTATSNTKATSPSNVDNPH